MSASKETSSPETFPGTFPETSPGTSPETETVSPALDEETNRPLSTGFRRTATVFTSFDCSDSLDHGPQLPQLLDDVLTAVKVSTGSQLCTVHPRVPLSLADDSLDGPDSRVLLVFKVQVPASSIRGILQDHRVGISRTMTMGPLTRGSGGSTAGRASGQTSSYSGYSCGCGSSSSGPSESAPSGGGGQSRQGRQSSGTSGAVYYGGGGDPDFDSRT